MKVLITGSNGYIGSCLFNFLIKKNFQVLGIDKNINNSFVNGKQVKCNILNYAKTKNIIKNYRPDTIIHLAGESTLDNIKEVNKYKKNNIEVTVNIAKICKYLVIKKLIFSSTAAVYKESKKPIVESFIKKPNNIYGKTKLIAENKLIKILRKTETKFIIFRFFNVCSSLGNVGENHSPETHLVPLITQKFYERKKILIYGNNFKTKDKTCIRDYIHIKDVCNAFLKAIYFFKKGKKKFIIFNLGSNKGFSILELLNFFINEIKFSYIKKRLGDNDKLICDSVKARKILKWSPADFTSKKIFNNEIKWHKHLISKGIKRVTIY